MGRIIVIANQKGGVAKSTTTRSLATCLAMKNYKVLVVDGDPQGNVTNRFTFEEVKELTFADLISAECMNRNEELMMKKMGEDITEIEYDTADAISVSVDNVHVLRTNKDSSLAIACQDIDKCWDKTTIIRSIIEQVRDSYDYIIVDTPPTFGTIILNLLNVADDVIIPVCCELDSYEAINTTFKNIKLLKRTTNKNIALNGILLTDVDKTVISTLFTEKVNNLDAYVYETIIPHRVAMKEADLLKQSIFETEEKNKKGQRPVAEAYEKFTEEFLRREEQLVALQEG